MLSTIDIYQRARLVCDLEDYLDARSRIALDREMTADMDQADRLVYREACLRYVINSAPPPHSAP